jgi:hypothetical protein
MIREVINAEILFVSEWERLVYMTGAMIHLTEAALNRIDD